MKVAAARLVGLIAALCLAACSSIAETEMPERAEWRLVIHGGAGVILRENMTPEREAAFEAGLNQLTADYNGMVRYRMLLAQGKISQPYALHEDRGVTGGHNEMRVGDRALRITGPSQFLTGGELWKPADR